MSAKKLTTIPVFYAVVVLLLAGCDNFFASNVFGALDGPPKLNLEEDLEEEDLESLAVALQSDEIYQDLDANPDQAEKVEAYLADLSTSPTADSQTKATASDALAEFYKNTTPAGKTVSNVAGLLDVVMSGDSGDSSTPQMDDVIGSIVPAESLRSSESFAELVGGLKALDSTYEAMNAALEDPNGTVEDPGAAFQGALVSYALTETLDAVVVPDNGDPNDDEQQKIDALYAAISADDPAAAPPIEFAGDFDPASLVTGMAEDGSGVENIVAEAGFTSLVEGLAAMFGESSTAQ
jgi:hypothetical protein